jgi:hypothetical protein
MVADLPTCCSVLIMIRRGETASTAPAVTEFREFPARASDRAIFWPVATATASVREFKKPNGTSLGPHPRIFKQEPV